MPNVNENSTRITDLIRRIKDHPLCLKFEESEDKYLVFYPVGDFAYYSGIQAQYCMGKINGLTKILERMEQDWVSSYPGSVSPYNRKVLTDEMEIIAGNHRTII